MKERLKSIIACPKCKSRVNFREQRIECPECKEVFEIKNDIPFMIKEGGHKDKDVEREPSSRKSSLFRLLKRIANPKSPTYKTKESRDKIRQLVGGMGPDKCIVNVGSGLTRYSDEIVNIDIGAYNNVDIVCDATELSILDESVDMFISQAVLEHVRDPSVAVSEMYRVLKKGRLVYAEIPFMQSYHPHPTDFQRYSIEGIENLFSQFEMIEKGVVAGPSSALTNFLRYYFAILLSGNSGVMFKLWFTLSSWFALPIKYLDVFTEKSRFSHYIASGFFFLGKKNE